MKRNVLYLSAAIILLVLLLLSLLVFRNRFTPIEFSLEQDSYTIDLEYNREKEQWEYTITGEKPTPCHSIDIDFMEYEELQVEVIISEIKPSENAICSQVVEEVKKEGVYVGGGEEVTFTNISIVEVNNEFDQTSSKDTIDNAPEPDAVTITKEDFLFQPEYKENNTWTYTIEGTLPSGCYQATSDTVNSENYPEQVTVFLRVEDICDNGAVGIQSLQEINIQETVSANSAATFDFVVQVE